MAEIAATVRAHWERRTKEGTFKLDKEGLKTIQGLIEKQSLTEAEKKKLLSGLQPSVSPSKMTDHEKESWERTTIFNEKQMVALVELIPEKGKSVTYEISSQDFIGILPQLERLDKSQYASG